MSSEILNVVQKTQKWLDVRAKSVFSASEASALMGCCIYGKTTVFLLNEKTGIFNKDYKYEIGAGVLSSMQAGNAYEEFVLTRYRYFSPVVFSKTYGEEYACIASLDGYREESDTVLEVKLVSFSLFCTMNNTKKLPPHIYSQVQAQLLISGASKAIVVYSYFVSRATLDIDPDKYLNEIHVEVDVPFQNELKRRILAFGDIIKKVKARDITSGNDALMSLKDNSLNSSYALSCLDSPMHGSDSWLDGWKDSPMFKIALIPFLKDFEVNDFINGILKEEEGTQDIRQVSLKAKNVIKMKVLQEQNLSLNNFADYNIEHFKVSIWSRSIFNKEAALEMLRKHYSEEEIKEKVFQTEKTLAFKRRTKLDISKNGYNIKF